MTSSFLRRTALSAALATGAATMVAVPPSLAEDRGADTAIAAATNVDLTGTLLVVAGEHGEPDTYAVKRPNGQVVHLDPGTVDAFDHDVATSDRFAGTVTLPVVNGRSATLRGAASSGTALRVASAAINPRPTASGPVVHRLAVVQTTNLGPYTRDAAALMAQIKGATDYWIDQADGKIAGYEIPAAPVPYTATKTSVASGCGLTGDQTSAPEFTPTVEEAATLFPGYDFVNGTDQLIVLMPDGCFPPTGGAVGRGRGGVSLASGGSVIAANFPNLSDVLAHEFGHNYGLMHAKSPTQEYGDIYEVMGAADNNVSPELGTGYRHEQGLLQPGEVTSLTGASSSATIADRGSAAESGVRGVEVINPDNGDRLWFDLRTGAGSDAGAEYRLGPDTYNQVYRAAGVTVTKDVDAGVQLQFVNNQTALVAGETWSNASGSMKVTVSALGAGSATVNSAYAPGAPLTGGTVKIVGNAAPFQRVSASATGFTPAAAGVRYQWFANGALIPDEEEASLTVPLSLAGASLTVQATGYATGAAPQAVTSAAVKVSPAEFYVRTDTANQVTVSGKYKSGQVLTTSGLDWVGDNGVAPVGLTSTFQWYRGSKAIKGATSSSYRLQGADVKKYVTVRNIASAPGFETADARSGSGSLVKKGKLPSAKPKIKFKGKKAKPGTKLKAKPGAWVGKTKFRFQWYAGSRKIRGANKKSFVVPRGLRKAKISVKVSGSKKGYKSTSRRSGKVKIR